jgi:hypothetical protein
MWCRKKISRFPWQETVKLMKMNSRKFPTVTWMQETETLRREEREVISERDNINNSVNLEYCVLSLNDNCETLPSTLCWTLNLIMLILICSIL